MGIEPAQFLDPESAPWGVYVQAKYAQNGWYPQKMLLHVTTVDIQ